MPVRKSTQKLTNQKLSNQALYILAIAALAGTATSGFAQPAPQPESAISTKLITYTAVLPELRQDPPAPNGQQPKPAQPKPPRNPRYEIYIGPSAGVYIPNSAKTQNRFGSAWFDYGFSFFPVYTSTAKGRFNLDLQFLANTSGDDSLFFGLIGVEYRRSFLRDHAEKPAAAAQPGANAAGQPNAPNPAAERAHDYVPYFGFSADEVVGDLVAVEDNVHSGVRTGVAGSAFMGITWRNRAYIEARYMQTSVLKSFDLSGFSLNIGCRFRISGY